jgi:transposase-like protein
MMRPVNSVLWNEWRLRLKRQRESGLSITAFCRGENLSPHTFHAWRRKLQPARQVRGIAATRQGRASSTALPSSTGFLQLPLAAGPQSPWIELALADGTVVRVPQQNIAVVLAVLRVLRGESRDMTLGERDDA